MNKMMVILGVVILIGIAGVFLLNSSQSNIQPATQEPTQNTEFDYVQPTDSSGSTGSSGQSSVKEFTIESKGLNFTPNEIKVNVGDRVRIVYKNTLGTHDWTLDEFNAQTQLINAGEIATVEFVADKAGSFEFYCSVPGHREAGMKGTLVVK